MSLTAEKEKELKLKAADIREKTVEEMQAEAADYKRRVAGLFNGHLFSYCPYGGPKPNPR